MNVVGNWLHCSYQNLELTINFYHGQIEAVSVQNMVDITTTSLNLRRSVFLVNIFVAIKNVGNAYSIKIRFPNMKTLWFHSINLIIASWKAMQIDLYHVESS